MVASPLNVQVVAALRYGLLWGAFTQSAPYALFAYLLFWLPLFAPLYYLEDGASREQSAQAVVLPTLAALLGALLGEYLLLLLRARAYVQTHSEPRAGNFAWLRSALLFGALAAFGALELSAAGATLPVYGAPNDFVAWIALLVGAFALLLALAALYVGRRARVPLSEASPSGELSGPIYLTRQSRKTLYFTLWLVLLTALPPLLYEQALLYLPDSGELWLWVLLTQLVLYAGFGLYTWLYFEREDRATPSRESPRMGDAAGSARYAAAQVLLLLALDAGSYPLQHYSDDTPRDTLLLLLVVYGPALAVVFFLATVFGAADNVDRTLRAHTAGPDALGALSGAKAPPQQRTLRQRNV